MCQYIGANPHFKTSHHTSNDKMRTLGCSNKADLEYFDERITLCVRYNKIFPVPLLVPVIASTRSKVRIATDDLVQTLEECALYFDKERVTGMHDVGDIRRGSTMFVMTHS